MVASILGEANYRVLLSDGRIWHRHVDQMVKRHPTYGVDQDAPIVREHVPLSDLDFVPDIPLSQPVMPNRAVVNDVVPVEAVLTQERRVVPEMNTDRAADGVAPSVASPASAELRRSTRVRKRPAKLEDYV